MPNATGNSPDPRRGGEFVCLVSFCLEFLLKVKPETLPKIMDLMNCLDDLTYTASDGSEVTLLHAGTRFHPDPINVKIDRQNRATIRTDGSFSAPPDIAELLRLLNQSPRPVLKTWPQNWEVRHLPSIGPPLL